MTTQEYAIRCDKMNDAFATESDRGCAAIAAGVIDEALEQIFLRRLRGGKKVADLLDANGPLGSNSTRLKLAYCLGWIGEATYLQADQIRRIRNEMAHKLDVDSFDHPTVQTFIDKLPLPLTSENVGKTNKYRFRCSLIGVVLHLLENLDECVPATGPPDEAPLVL